MYLIILSTNGLPRGSPTKVQNKVTPQIEAPPLGVPAEVQNSVPPLRCVNGADEGCSGNRLAGFLSLLFACVHFRCIQILQKSNSDTEKCTI